ncbi:hypothetical protein GLOTRDRAFT_90876 [Gloeophyllum trabeum ATCC 11539]|uniref:Uncharacterized protein n=1 Tax=Gloeophyllum trabeum (strain ATCC 11539 / FP-39264 / Madison 617) TaxID=670483 RepID=S7QIP8_GLOTA|nr:uncharacterized protein GLOTRDRAFT_90876 [Gloeophyllum trabeum ATCC 11539]EPQ59212.1 hypothetical protein GLOTRDRAFT_90876 [Gloeophyllum trabeum ATCC 11539]
MQTAFLMLLVTARLPHLAIPVHLEEESTNTLEPHPCPLNAEETVNLEEEESEADLRDLNDSSEGYQAPPCPVNAKAALADVTEILYPHRKSGKGYKKFEEDDLLSSLATAQAFQKGPHAAKQLQKWAWLFIDDCDDLPWNLYGTWNVSLLVDGDLAMRDPPASARKICQYADGHKHADVVKYQQEKFLPTMAQLQYNMHCAELSPSRDNAMICNLIPQGSIQQTSCLGQS